MRQSRQPRPTRLQRIVIRTARYVPLPIHFWYIKRVVLRVLMPYARMTRRELASYYVRKYVLRRKVRRVTAYERANALAMWDSAKFGGR